MANQNVDCRSGFTFFSGQTLGFDQTDLNHGYFTNVSVDCSTSPLSLYLFLLNTMLLWVLLPFLVALGLVVFTVVSAGPANPILPPSHLPRIVDKFLCDYGHLSSFNQALSFQDRDMGVLRLSS